MSLERTFGIRYLVEPWNKPVDSPVERTGDPHVVQSTTNYGYCDHIFVASIACDAFGNPTSVLLLDDQGKNNPSREVLELVKQQIEYHLQHHCPPPYDELRENN